MALIYPNTGEAYDLACVVAQATPANLTARLFANDYVPVEGTIASYLTECVATGYSAKTIAGADWTIVTDGSGNTTATSPQQVFSLTAGGTLYGYYVMAGSILLCAERFASPLTIPSDGGSVAITIVLGAE